MKSAALPAAEFPESAATTTPHHLRLVSEHHTAPRIYTPRDSHAELHSAEDPDEMWDNLPV